jgi:quinol monooxygenase YgiN
MDISFFEVEPGDEERFEREFGDIVAQALAAVGCRSSELIRLNEERRYCWLERWESRDAHQRFNEFLFDDIVPGHAELIDAVRRLEERDAEGVAVAGTSG